MSIVANCAFAHRIFGIATAVPNGVGPLKPFGIVIQPPTLSLNAVTGANVRDTGPVVPSSHRRFSPYSLGYLATYGSKLSKFPCSRDDRYAFLFPFSYTYTNRSGYFCRSFDVANRIVSET